MAFQTPPSRSCVIASPLNERNMKTPSDMTGESACAETDLSLSKQEHKYSSTKLDRIQRLQREHTERCNAELQSFSVMDKLRNAEESLPSMECGHSDAEFSFPPLSFAQIEEPIEQGSNQEGPPNHSSNRGRTESSHSVQDQIEWP